MKAMRYGGMQSGLMCEEPMNDLRALNYCGEATCVLGAELAPDRHACFEFLYIISGSAKWKVGRRQVGQEMGEMFVTLARELHSTAGPLPVMHHLWIGLELDKMGPAARRVAARLRKTDARVLPGCHAVEPILRAIVGAVATPLPDQRKVVLAYLDVFFALVEQRLKLLDMPEEAKTYLPYSHQVQTAISYMQRNLHRALALSELVHVANMRHASNFCVLFRREVGETPAAHHLRIRLDAARDSLLQPTSDITSVALGHGFNSHQHFSTAFRKAFGMTPLRWKKQRPVAKQ